MARSRSLIVFGMVLTVFSLGAAAAAVGVPRQPVVDATTATWSAPDSFLPRQGDLRSVSCPSLAFCGALDVWGGFFVRTDKNWSRREQLETRLTLISCVSSTFCAGLSYNGRASLFDGTSWSPAETIDPSFKISSLSCANRSFCMAVDSGGRSMTYQGADWKVAKIGADVLNDVTCVSDSFCMAVGAAGEVWQFDGSTWTETENVAMNGGAGISCASTTLCAIVDNFHGVETFDGTSWSPHLRIDDANFLLDVSCVKAFCLATDEGGRGFAYQDGVWQNSGSDLFVPMKSVSCPRPSRCVAVGPTGDAASFATMWRDLKAIDPEAGFPAAVSCPSDRFCMVADDFGTSIAFDDGSWGRPKEHSYYEFVTISCPTAVFCMAVNEVGDAYAYSHHEWLEQVRISLYDDLSCTPSFCMAVGRHPFTAYFDGSTWTRILIDSPRGLVSISCPTGKLCVGLRSNGAVYTYNGKSWSADGSGAVPHGRISCASEDFCVAITAAGEYSIFDGSVWSAPTHSGGQGVTSLSCPADDNCMAVTSSDRALRYSDGVWTVTDVLDPTGGGFTSVSCWAVDSCRAVTHSGDLLTYE